MKKRVWGKNCGEEEDVEIGKEEEEKLGKGCGEEEDGEKGKRGEER